jgi:hypothetical protein
MHITRFHQIFRLYKELKISRRWQSEGTLLSYCHDQRAFDDGELLLSNTISQKPAIPGKRAHSELSC